MLRKLCVKHKVNYTTIVDHAENENQKCKNAIPNVEMTLRTKNRNVLLINILAGNANDAT